MEGEKFQGSNLVRQLSLAVQEPLPSAGVITELRQQIRDIDEEFISGPRNCGLNRVKTQPCTFSI